MNDPSITPSMLMQGIRRSLRGHASPRVSTRAQPKVTHLSAGGHMEQKIDALTEQLSQVKKTLKQFGLHGSQQPSSTVIQHPPTPQPSVAFRMPPAQQTGVASINPAFPQGRTNFRGKCFKCGKVGHKKAFCPGN